MTLTLTPEEAAKYPEYAKAAPHMGTDESEAIGQFVEWLGSQGYFVCDYATLRKCWPCATEIPDDELVDGIYCPECGKQTSGPSDFPRPIQMSPEAWVAAYHGIDYTQYRKEREHCIQALLAAQRQRAPTG